MERTSGVPEAYVTWWQNNRIISNGTELVHPWESQLYKVSESITDEASKISELFIFDIRSEDAGVYYCRGNNAAGWARANFTITVVKRKEEKTLSDTQADKQMFQVEYILGFGAAVLIILTIIIVLILYLILQCKQRRRDERLRKLICDSHSSGSLTDRSTVDYIVPGEMELMSAVRSVSCNSTMSKCKQGGDEEEYGPEPPIIDSLFVKNKQPDCPPPPPPPPNGLSCSNPDLVQDTKLWDRVPGHSADNFLGMNGSIQQGNFSHQGVYPQGGNYAPHQYFPPGGFYTQMHNFVPPHVRLQYLHGGGMFQPINFPQGSGPGYASHYRAPPPVQYIQQKSDDSGETVLSANGLSVYPKPENVIWRGPPQFQYYQFPTEQHTKDCPRSKNHSGYSQVMQAGNGESYVVDRLSGQSYMHPMYAHPRHFAPPPYNPPPSVSNWSAEEDELKYGPFSDGEAETIKRPPRHHRRGGYTRGHPHYATMSRTNGWGSRSASRYSSQPQLASSFEQLDKEHPHSGVLSPFSIKTSITLPRQIQPIHSDSLNCGTEPGYTDLARHPLSYSAAPASFTSVYSTQRQSVQIQRSDSLDSQNQYQNSRSSLVGDMEWSKLPPRPGTSCWEDTESPSQQDLWVNGRTADWVDGHQDCSSAAALDEVKLALNGVRKRPRGGGAVKVDLSCADKSIRRPESAPDLVSVGDQVGSGGTTSSSRQQSRRSSRERTSLERSNSSENRAHSNPLSRKPGVSPAGRKQVVFAGIDDSSSSSSEDKGSKGSLLSDEEVWVKRPQDPSTKEDDIPVTGVVIAKPNMCQYYPANGAK